MKIEGHAPEIQLRYNFTYNFLVGAASLTKMAIEIEKKGKSSTEIERFEHKAFVAGCIMQSVAALESEVWSLLNLGPGHHLGSDGLEKESKETLSIVAYKQPVTRAEIDAIRGVGSDGVIDTLMKRKLINVCGKKDTPGKPLLYGTTPDFLNYFGLKTLEELPPLKKETK